MKLDFRFTAVIGVTHTDGNVVVSPDGNSVYSIVGRRISVFDVSAEQSGMKTFGFLARRGLKVICISPNGKHMVAFEDGGRCFLINMQSGTAIARVTLGKMVTAASFSPDSRVFAVASGRFVQIWSVPIDPIGESYMPLRLKVRIRCHSDTVISLSWSKCSRFIVTASEDMTCRVLWLDARRGYIPPTLAAHRDALIGSFFIDETTIVTVSREGAVFVWNTSLIEEKGLEMNGEEGSSEGEEEEKEMDVSDGIGVAGGGGSGGWIVKTKHYLGLTGRHVVATSFCVERCILAVGLSSGHVGIYSIGSELLGLATLEAFGVMSVALIGSRVGIGGNGEIALWDWENEGIVLKQRGAGVMRCMAFGPDGLIAVGGKGILLFGPTRFCHAVLEVPASVESLNFMGSRILLASLDDGTIRVYDVGRYRCFRTFALESSRLKRGVGDPVGNEIVAAAGDTLTLWNVRTGNLLESIGTVISNVIWDPLGRWIGAGGGSEVYIVSPFSKGEGGTIRLGSEIVGFGVRGDGGLLAVSTLHSTIHLIDPLSVSMFGCIDCGSVINSLDISVDGSLILGGSGSIMNFYGESGQLFRSISVETNCLDVRFSPDSRVVGVVSEGQIVLFSLDETLVFDPIDLAVEVTPERFEMLLRVDTVDALVEAVSIAIRLSDINLIYCVLVHIAERGFIPQVISRLGRGVVRLVPFLATLATMGHFKILEPLLHWTKDVLLLSQSLILPCHRTSLRTIEAQIRRLYMPLSALANENRYLLHIINKQMK